MLSTYLAIGFGGAFGALSRAILVKILPETLFNIPAPILIVNILGCFTIGILAEIFANFWGDNEILKLFLTTGL